MAGQYQPEILGRRAVHYVVKVDDHEPGFGPFRNVAPYDR
jgi:hypothetical protein